MLDLGHGRNHIAGLSTLPLELRLHVHEHPLRPGIQFTRMRDTTQFVDA